jgi:hypothetical protein
VSAAASAYGTAFWAATALTAIAIVPSLLLVRAERQARRANAQATPTESELAEAVAV